MSENDNFQAWEDFRMIKTAARICMKFISSFTG